MSVCMAFPHTGGCAHLARAYPAPTISPALDWRRRSWRARPAVVRVAEMATKVHSSTHHPAESPLLPHCNADGLAVIPMDEELKYLATSLFNDLDH
jgi:hypothetical protein